MQKTGWIITLIIFFLMLNCASKVKITRDMSAQDRFAACKELIIKKKYLQAITELERVRYEFSGTEYYVEVIYRLAEARRLNQDYPEALVNYQLVSRDYPNHVLAIPSAFFSAMCYEKMSNKAELDPENTIKAISSYNELIIDFPNSTYADTARNHIEKLNNKLAEKEYKNGLLYYKIDQYKAAEIYLKTVIVDYFQSNWTDDSFYILGLVYLKLNQKEEAELMFERLIQQFPNSPLIKKAQKEIKQLSDIDHP